MFYAYQIEYLFIAFHTDFTSLTIYPSHKKESHAYFQLVYCNATRIQILLILAFITANDCICCMHIAGTVVMNRIRTLDWSFGNILTSTEDQPLPWQLPIPRTKEAKTPLQVFQLFLTTVIVEAIVQQTKLHICKQERCEPATLHRRTASFHWPQYCNGNVAPPASTGLLVNR